ncbi:MAG TPA: hypothetical protein VKJ07_11550, partial [Mycobacteriales bacterium]|nr:hypothetical protein [Mycobacteriales bacterium]
RGLVAALALLLGCGSALDGAALDGAAGAATLTSTAQVVIRPVTSTGQVVAGFSVTSEPTGSVDCSTKQPSPGAVSPNIEFCSPSAEYAIACWRALLQNRVLCMRDPRTKDVYRIPRIGAFASTPVASVFYRAPLVMKLGDGDFCSIRDGGAWGTLNGHPNLYGTYSCVNAGIVWAYNSSAHFGVDETHPIWTVATAPAGNHTLVTRHVVKAWFVGTAS